MSALTSPAASSIALPAPAAPPSANASHAPSSGGFCEVMNDKKFKPAAKESAGDDKGQDDAATGKDLPEKDKDVDPALAWLFGPPTVLPPIPAPKPPIGPDISVVSDGSIPEGLAPISGQKIADVIPAVIEPPVTIDTPVADLPVAKPTNDAPVTPQPIKLPLLQPAKTPLPTPVSLNPTPAPSVAALPALFALSMTDRMKRDDDSISSLTPTTASSLSQPTTTLPVAPMGDAQRQTLDMGRQDWPQKMIDHIEALRDNANANDTSIRLKPEALGRVDIALRTHTDGAISVRFTAEQPNTRTMLVDATPQLSAAAEARGIRLSGTSVDLSGQGDQRPHPQAERTQPISNRLATTRGDDNQAVEDGRIA
ncbi:flagellar hook-length control protein FliK [Sphingomonas panacisoli]|nr:flagellar hook-length control protein FliK [Sphingomonas panacisoli]